MEEVFDCDGIFDSHAHYFDKRFESETQGADAVLRERVFDSGVEGVINVGTNNKNNRCTSVRRFLLFKIQVLTATRRQATLQFRAVSTGREALPLQTKRVRLKPPSILHYIIHLSFY